MNVSAVLSANAQATLLLTCYFSKTGNEDIRPLTNGEWGRFALWLKEKSTTPADLLVSEPKSLLGSWHDSHISVDRIIQLLNRGHSLALAVEKWQRAGLWVVTRSDPEYPNRLKQRLKTNSPPVLFGCGNKALLNADGLAVIGSRNASDADLSFTEQVGAKAASEGIAIVSGGARGVDEAAMLGAIHQGGAVIGVMADSLLKAATSVKWRKGLLDGHAVLISPFYPEAGFSAGNAMARNKYIYCLAGSALVIHSGKTGGTLNGAEENLKKGWVPLWIKPTTDKDTANADLVAKGGRWCVADIQAFTIADLLTANQSGAIAVQKELPDLFSVPEQSGSFTLPESVPSVKEPESPTFSTSETVENEAVSEPVDFYRVFIGELNRLATNPVTVDELVKLTALHRSQLAEWLRRAVGEGVVKKLNRPVRYQAIIRKANLE